MKALISVLCALTVLAMAGLAGAHCEVPCGIYGDQMRFAMMREDIATVEKAMKQVAELSKAGDKNYNQIVRWVVNKEEHATKVQEVAWQYFLAQRIKAPKDADAREAYLRKLEMLHLITVYAMKCKQGRDLGMVDKLKGAVDAFDKAYMGKK